MPRHIKPLWRTIYCFSRFFPLFPRTLWFLRKASLFFLLLFSFCLGCTEREEMVVWVWDKQQETLQMKTTEMDKKVWHGSAKGFSLGLTSDQHLLHHPTMPKKKDSAKVKEKNLGLLVKWFLNMGHVLFAFLTFAIIILTTIYVSHSWVTRKQSLLGTFRYNHTIIHKSSRRWITI